VARRNPLASGSRLIRGAVFSVALTLLLTFAHSSGILDEALSALKDSYSNEASEPGSHLPKDPGSLVKHKTGADTKDGDASAKPTAPATGSTGGAKTTSGTGSQAVRKAMASTNGDKTQWSAALKSLASLPVKGRAPLTGYSRDFFGSAWSDSYGDFYWTRDGLDTRNDILSRDLVNVKCAAGTTSKKTGYCKVNSGTLLYDPYSGATQYRFDSTDDDYSTDLDAEHVVALGDAYVTGAQSWPLSKREAYANDPLVLMMVNPSLNRQKGDADAASWLPPNKAYRAAYVTRQIAIKGKYGLWVTPAEHDAMQRVLTQALGR